VEGKPGVRVQFKYKPIFLDAVAYFLSLFFLLFFFFFFFFFLSFYLFFSPVSYTITASLVMMPSVPIQHQLTQHFCSALSVLLVLRHPFLSQRGWDNELTFNNPGVKNTFHHGQSLRERQKMKKILRDIAIKEGRTPPPDSEEDSVDGDEGEDGGVVIPQAAAQIYAKMEAERMQNRKAGIDKQNRLGETTILRATQNGDEDLVSS